MNFAPREYIVKCSFYDNFNFRASTLLVFQAFESFCCVCVFFIPGFDFFFFSLLKEL